MNRRQFLTTLSFAAASLGACAAPSPPQRQPSMQLAHDRTLTIGSVEEPDTLNPCAATKFTSAKIAWGVMDGLLAFDESLKLQSGLAESHAVSEDGLTYTFKLRRGVTWHDGAPFSAADVIATWQAMMDPAVGAFDQTGWSQITDIETPDEHSVVMRTREVFAPFLAFVAGMSRIAPKHWIDKGAAAFKQEFGRAPVGTGPYRFVAWDAGQRIELAANTNYYGGRPKIGRIVFKFVPDTNTLLTQIRTGEVDMTDALGAPEYEAARALPNHVTQALTGQNWAHIDLKNIGFLTDKRVRQALDYATPREQIVSQLLQGQAVTAIGDQSPITAFHHPELKPRPFDLGKAAALLAEAGFAKNAGGILEKDSQPLRIEYYIGSGDKQAALVQQAVAASWRQLGIDVEELQQDPRVWTTADGYVYSKAVTAGQYEWFNAIDPENMFFWHSSYVPREPGGMGGNYPAVFSPYEQQARFDALTLAGDRELDHARRVEIYRQIQELLHEEVPVIFLYWGKRIFVAPKDLKYTTNAGLALLFNAETWEFKG